QLVIAVRTVSLVVLLTAFFSADAATGAVYTLSLHDALPILGVAIVPGGAVPAELQADLVSRPLKLPELTRTIGATFIKDRTLTPSARGFLSHLQQAWPDMKA